MFSDKGQTITGKTTALENRRAARARGFEAHSHDEGDSNAEGHRRSFLSQKQSTVTLNYKIE